MNRVKLTLTALHLYVQPRLCLRFWADETENSPAVPTGTLLFAYARGIIPYGMVN